MVESVNHKRQSVVVSRIVDEAVDIRSFELVNSEGKSLSPFEAGAHIYIYLKEGLARQYSLCNDPNKASSYQIAVLNEAAGRGGSRHMHEHISEGDVLEISYPDNNFPLAKKGAKHHLMFAGGIGVTPMVAMIYELERNAQSYTMHYCTRTEENTAFRDKLRSICTCGEILFHHDNGNPKNSLDIQSALGEYKVGVHLYACGPAGFMCAVNQAARNWPPHVVHQEYFGARELSEEEKAWDKTSFEIVLSKSNLRFQVPAGQSISDTLEKQGIQIDVDCQEGYCGTCITRYLGGEPVHRDSVLDNSDRDDFVMICCARSKSDRLILDL